MVFFFNFFFLSEMFLRASRKLGLGKAIMGSMANEINKEVMVTKAKGDTNKNQSKSKSKTDAKQINQLLKHGAYHVFDEDNSEADKFCAEDIEKILKDRATDILYEAGKSKPSSFSKASFVASDAAAGIDINDRDFWAKVLPAELVSFFISIL